MTANLARRSVAEFLGTWAIVFFGCGAIVTLRGQETAHLAVNTVFGLVVAASIIALGAISGAHFNPAVTIGFASVRRFPMSEVAAYIAAQCAGAMAASLMHFFLLGGAATQAAFGATTSTNSVGIALGAEVALTFFLMFVIGRVATDRRVPEALPALAIGMAVLLCGLFGGPVSGCSMNPARSLGPAVFAQGLALSSLWIYLVGPVVGALLAARLSEWLGYGESSETT